MSGLGSSWSRRRAAVAAEAAEQEQAAETAVLEEQHKALAEKTDEEILEELGLPDPDALVQGDDFKAFMSKAVPAHLRKRALRTLWRSNPVLACVDGLNDYDDDYLAASIGQGPIKTTYQVGKGMLAHLLEMDRQKEAALEPEATVAAAEPDEELVETFVEDAPVEDVEHAQVDQDAPVMPTARRMTFQFEDDTA